MKVINPLSLVYEGIKGEDGYEYSVVHAPEIDSAKEFDLQVLLDMATQKEKEAYLLPKEEVIHATVLKAKASMLREVFSLIESSLGG